MPKCSMSQAAFFDLALQDIWKHANCDEIKFYFLQGPLCFGPRVARKEMLDHGVDLDQQ